MMPGPGMPNVQTISHILISVQKAIGEFDLPGKLLPTFRFPNHTTVAARVIPLIADLQAIRKVAGYVSHAADLFCSFCKCVKDDVEDLAHHTWHLRTGAEVRHQAEEWHNAITVAKKEEIVKKTGVRWTPLHNLPYWNPVSHVMLGYMHNFLEGVLQYQLRSLWGIGRSKSATTQATLHDTEETLSEAEISESQDELDGLSQEAEEVGRAGSETGLTEIMGHVTMLDSDIINLDVDMDSDDNAASTQSTPRPLQFLDLDNDSEDDDYIPSVDTGMFNFSSAEISQIRACIHDVALPTCVQRPPSNLGEASHGKLKAHELLVLFSIIFPLIIPELWWMGNSTAQDMLASFCNLVAATNIISSYSTSNADADAYMVHYIKYRASIQKLFPDFKSMPNHHYAMHNGQLLKFWGPLALLSEFPGERLNGDFGQMKTNRRLGDIELTLIQNTSRRGRLDALLHDGVFHNETLKDFANLLRPTTTSGTQQMDQSQIGQALANGVRLNEAHYTQLLNYLNASGRQFISAYSAGPFSLSSLVLPPVARNCYQYKIEDRTYSCHQRHVGNSQIRFYIPGQNQMEDTGVIEAIWELTLDGALQTFLLIRKHQPLPAAELLGSPFSIEPCTYLKTKIVDIHLSETVLILEPRHIICHLSSYRRPAGTFGLNTESLVVCWALNRGRR